MADYVGTECKLNIMVGAITTSPYTGGVATEVTLCRDNNLSMTANAIDKTSRANGGWKSKRAGLRDWSDSFDMIYYALDPAWILLQAAFDVGTTIVVEVRDGATGAGILGPVIVTGFDRGESLDDILTTKVTLEGAGAPVWVDAS